MYKYIVLKNPSINTICLHFTDALDWDVREYNLAPNITQKKTPEKRRKLEESKCKMYIVCCREIGIHNFVVGQYTEYILYQCM